MLADFVAGVPILGLDQETAEAFARLRFGLRFRGELLADHDTWIAATAGPPRPRPHRTRPALRTHSRAEALVGERADPASVAECDAARQSNELARGIQGVDYADGVEVTVRPANRPG